MSKPVLDPNKYGIRVQCTVCHRTKQPVGRSAPMQSDYCDFECLGYGLPPHIGGLWSNESEADFGYPVSDVGTEIRTR